MTVTVWGELPKAQDNNQTISQAINAAIAAHEADPQAHLGTGESLETHRANDVIDHPAGSVLADKITTTEWQLNTIFESLDAWSTIGTVSNSDLTGAQLYVEYGDVDTSRIYSNPQIVTNFFDKDVFILTQYWAKFDLSTSDFNAWMGMLTNYTSGTEGFGFQIRDGALYAHVRGGSTTTDELLTGFDLGVAHIYRAQYSPQEENVVFYIDGEAIATIPTPAGTAWEDDTGPQAGITLTEANDGRMIIGNLYAARSL